MPVIKVPMALIVVMCVARSAMTMAFADALPLTLQASNTSNVVHARYLKQTADATTSVDNGGGRRLAINFLDLEAEAPAAKLNQGRPAIPLTSKVKLDLLLLKEKFIQADLDNVYKDFNLHKVKGNIFESQNFANWEYFNSKLGSDEKFQANRMFNALKKAIKPDASLIKVLGQAKGSHGDKVDYFRNFLMQYYWTHENCQSLFTRLGMKPATSSSSDFETYAKQFNSPEFTMWATFVTKEELYDDAFKALRTDEGDDAIVMRALARITGESYEFAQNMIYSRLIMFAEHKDNPQVLLKELELEKAWPTVLIAARVAGAAEKAGKAEAEKAEAEIADIIKSLGNDDKVLIRAWLDYVYMISLDNYDHISSDLVSQNIILKDSPDEEVMKWLNSDITASEKRLAPIFERLNVWKNGGKKPSA